MKHRKLARACKVRLFVTLLTSVVLFLAWVNLDYVHVWSARLNILPSPLDTRPSRLLSPHQNRTQGDDIDLADTDVLHRLRARSKRLGDTCQKYNLKTTEIDTIQLLSRKNLFIDRFHKILYCSIEKVGSSFWKRVFKVLDDTNNTGKLVFNMSSMSAHASIPWTMQFSTYHTGNRMRMFQTYEKFAFVRDPFSRLFSAWLDKFYLPNPLTREVVPDIISQGMYPTGEQVCEQNISFPVLCHYVATSILSNRDLEPHLSLMAFHCNPCLMNLTLLGKMETFVEDTREILSNKGIHLEDVIGNDSSLGETSEIGIITDISLRTFAYLQNRDLGCLSLHHALTRLWTSFQVRGLISKTFPLPFPELSAPYDIIPKYDFIVEAVSAHKSSGPPEVRHRQRREAMIEAYGSVPRETISMLEKAFALDCLLFDYSCDLSIQLSKAGSARMGHIYFKET